MNSPPATDRRENHPRQGWRPDALFQLQVLLVVAIFLGGGGVAYGVRNLVIQGMVLVILALNGSTVRQFIASAPRGLVALVFLTIALPLLQLVPLSPSMWQSLPGRELVEQSFALLALADDRWFPLSVDRARTLVAFCGTLAPATIIIIGSMLSREEKVALCKVVFFACLAAFALGVVQIISGNSQAMLYTERNSADVFHATFANRNSTALFFVIAVIICSIVPLWRRPTGLLLVAAAGLLFSLAVVLTQSRSGVFLLLLALLFIAGRAAYIRWADHDRLQSHLPRLAIIGVLAVAMIGAGAIAVSVSEGSRAAVTLERFSHGYDDRPEMWEDGIYAAEQYWPVGSGMGTFDEVFQIHESLEFVSARKAGRLHSDWIEIAIEGGIFALLVALAWLLWIATAVLRRDAVGDLWLRLGAGLGLACIAMQSILDYPLRNQALLCVAALLVVLLVAPMREVVVNKSEMTIKLTWWVALAALAIVTTFAQLDRQARYDPQFALLAPAAMGGFALEQRAAMAIEARRAAQALQSSRDLVAARPMAAGHLAKLATAAALAGDEELATRALEAAASRGWREPLSNYASTTAAIQLGEHDVAAQRLNALLATGELRDRTPALLARLISTEDGREAFARRFAAPGRWQENTLTLVAQTAPPGDLAAMLARAHQLGGTLPCARIARLESDYRRRSEDAAADLLASIPC